MAADCKDQYVHVHVHVHMISAVKRVPGTLRTDIQTRAVIHTRTAVNQDTAEINAVNTHTIKTRTAVNPDTRRKSRHQCHTYT